MTKPKKPTLPPVASLDSLTQPPLARFCPKCGRPEEEYEGCGGFPVMPCPPLQQADPLTTVTFHCSSHDLTRTGTAVDIIRGKADLGHLCNENCVVTVIPVEGVTRSKVPYPTLGEAPPQVPASDAIIRDASLSETKPEGTTSVDDSSTQ